MRPQAHGRPGTPVAPAGWATEHALVVAETLPDRVIIRPPTSGEPTWNAVTQQVETWPSGPAYDGPARITLMSSIGDSTRITNVADELIPHRLYRVTLERDVADLADGMVVEVIETSDVLLVDQVLTLQGIERGSQRFSRVLTAVLTY